MRNIEEPPSGLRASTREPLDSAAIPRFLLAVAAAGGVDQQALARDAGLPRWALTADQSMVAPGCALRLWELLEHALDDPYYALRAAGLHRLGEMDTFDYLFMTSATLGQGLSASCRYLSLLTTNGLLRVEAATETETTYSYALVQNSRTRGGELALQTAVAAWCLRARAGTERPVTPVRVGFAQPAPRSYRPFVETFGTPVVDFGMSATTFTFRNRDLGLPLRGADPALSAILRRYAETLVVSSPATWHERFQQLLDEALEQGHPALDDMARRLIISRRTLQRRLEEQGTNWRAELESARQRRALLPFPSAPAGLPGLARRMGYADPRSARRALTRWENNGGSPVA
jgi:AraC-like DNA-binding protein